ncbi:hypothetical protein CONPUDRAFT_155557 [Coniophora puteana RWD-64-598 SS2]|uniref:WD40 repeat-like protein n=1 Tax=Coniophora puteana (strain RWD-64-598) TaxID=741705 RepID=A0A5M3MIT9_CONPW|nr:uncharacterized protein CONPUDRAFT_155557 [Coniophora puteana RWD-64-598 SS2]EIW78840.1 hypothetical protein CONPUDRAFT_155557 [Coniophora puteana RWD-64-598 SS2]
MFHGSAIAAKVFHETPVPLASSNYARHGQTTRKQTLLNLLEALNELNQDNIDEPPAVAADTGYPLQGDEERESPNVDERVQIAGAEAFARFERRMDSLDKELRNFANAARQLGSSSGILSSAFKLRERLTKVLFLFRENAANLFPRKVQRQSKESLVNPNLMDRRRRAAAKTKNFPQPPSAGLVLNESLDVETFPDQMESFAREVVVFLNCLNEFPEFTDEAVNGSIRSFEVDLKYWASCLYEYKTQFRFPAVQRYIHDLTSEIGDHIDNITVALSMFIEIGVPTIRFAQQHTASNLFNLSTIATFFSAVTATTLQFSYGQTGTFIFDLVNALWFTSLVFSIAASVNSLLGLTWQQAIYRSPGHRVPWWVLIWIKRSPLVFLVISVSCFSAGLMLFAYSTGQGYVTCTITTTCTVVTSFGLLAVSAWFASERWIFLKHRGQVWLQDVLVERITVFMQNPTVLATKRAAASCREKMSEVPTSLRRASTIGSYVFSKREEGPELPISRPPDGNGDGARASMTMSPPGRAPTFSSIVSAIAPSTTLGRSDREDGDDGRSETASTTNFDARERFINAIRTVIMESKRPKLPRRMSSAAEIIAGMSPSRFAEPAVAALRSSRLAALAPKLRALEITQELAPHGALVRHMQFSPNGKFLATSSWDKTSVLFRVGAQQEPFTIHRLLVHARGFIGQVKWCPSGHMLLTRFNRGIKVWSDDGVCRRTIERSRGIQSIAWVPGAEHFLSVEGNEVFRFDVAGQMLDNYLFGRMRLHNVAVTNDGQRILGVGALISSPSGLHPSRSSRVEKRVIVYNMESKHLESQIPVYSDVKDITISRKANLALISYENKTPPQLWKLELVKDRDHVSTVMRLSLRHTYMPKSNVDFSGPSYFGGKEDQLVLCAGKAGDLHIWDRDSAVLLHYIRPQALGDVTCIAWNQATDEQFMFATGSHDGTVRVWTNPSVLESKNHSTSSTDATASSHHPHPHVNTHQQQQQYANGTPRPSHLLRAAGRLATMEEPPDSPTPTSPTMPDMFVRVWPAPEDITIRKENTSKDRRNGKDKTRERSRDSRERQRDANRSLANNHSQSSLVTPTADDGLHTPASKMTNGTGSRSQSSLGMHAAYGDNYNDTDTRYTPKHHYSRSSLDVPNRRGEHSTSSHKQYASSSLDVPRDENYSASSSMENMNDQGARDQARYYGSEVSFGSKDVPKMPSDSIRNRGYGGGESGPPREDSMGTQESGPPGRFDE